MKLNKSFIIVALTGMLLTSCVQFKDNSEDKAEATTAVTGKVETASFSIDGMTCEIGCAKTIQKELAGMEGVQEATVDFEKKIATVKFDASKQTAEKLAKTVEAAADGKTYKVSDVKSSGDQAMLSSNDQEKEKKKKKSRRDRKASKESCSPEMEAKKGTPACCAAKKACHA